jgi:hypothetical protein
MLNYALVFIGSSVVCLPLAEGVFRLMGDRPSDDLAGLFAPFLNGSYKLAPHVETGARVSAGDFNVYTDDLGLRCDRLRQWAAVPDLRANAMFLGDSQGFGNGVNYEESIVGVVAEIASVEHTRVLNASVGGHGALNQLALAQWLRDERKVTAEIYILLATPLMIRYPDAFRQSTVGADGRLYESENHASARGRLWLKTHTVLYGRWRDAVRNSGFGDRPKEDTDQVFQLYTGSARVAPGNTFTSFLKEAKRFASETKAKLFVVYVPLTIEAEFDTIQKAAAAQNIPLDAGRPARICEQACADLGIPMHDLRPVLNRLRAQGDPLRLKGDFHYNRALSKACGEDLWARLKPQLEAAAYAAIPAQSQTTHEN